MISNYDVSQVGVVNALMAFSIKLNLAMNSELTPAVPVAPPVKSVAAVKVKAVLPIA